MKSNAVLLSVICMFNVFTICNASQMKTTAEEAFPAKTQTALAKAIAKDDCKKIAQILSTGEVNINVQGSEGVSLLMWAEGHHSKKAFKYLLEDGANPNLKANHGATAVSFAAMAEDSSYLQMVINHGADLNQKNDLGETPIYEAIDSLRVNNVDMLIAAGANLNIQNSTGDTPMMNAATLNQYDMVLQLLEKGADPTIKDVWGLTLMDTIRKSEPGPNERLNKSRECVIALLAQKGIHVNVSTGQP
jgi:uncharacterized protein